MSLLNDDEGSVLNVPPAVPGVGICLTRFEDGSMAILDRETRQAMHLNPDKAHQLAEFVGIVTTSPLDVTSKPTNPKDAVGVRKLPFSVLPWRVLHRVALAMLEGACKYGRHNYRPAGVRASVYFDAVVARHLSDWWEGVDIDPDSNLHHIDKAIAGLMVLRDSILHGNFVDDRPPAGKLDFAELNRQASEIIDRHADKTPHHYTIGDR